MTVIGLMSGASLEGIDVALVATDGERRLERRHSLTFPYAAEELGRLRDAMTAALAPLISPITVITLSKPLSFPCNSRLNLIQAR
jgi:1,6-anhydro-N-acetylmuramate kinase